MARRVDDQSIVAWGGDNLFRRFFLPGVSVLIFSIVTTFQIWACHVMCVTNCPKKFTSLDILLNSRKSRQICA